MDNQVQIKIESILLSAVEKLYNKEAAAGLDLEDFRILDIIYKISKESIDTTSTSPLSATKAPENLIDLLRAVRGTFDDRQ